MRTARHTGLLFATDLLTNLTDYGFHVFLGRALPPADFALTQTINALLLIFNSALGVAQPVVARVVADPAVDLPTRAGYLRACWRLSLLVGGLLSLTLWMGSSRLGHWLNLPVSLLQLITLMPLLALLRTVVAGVLQGEERFVAFGLQRCSFALARLIIASGLVGVGWGLTGAVAAQPLAALLALGGGVLVLGKTDWRAATRPPLPMLWAGLKLSAAAFCAYTAFMLLQNNDLFWVNRLFPAEAAGNYASAVLLRRMVALFPGAVVVILYPRLVAQVGRRQTPDRLLLLASGTIVGLTGGLTLLYLFFGNLVVRVALGSAYPQAGALLGWMGAGMIGHSLGSLWMNVYLATRPWPFVLLLAATVIGQAVLLGQYNSTLLQVTSVFALTGWFLALGGAILYMSWLRPWLQQMDSVA